ncbi:MAG TPA: OsmC family protein [Acidimicrobiales bacterium]|nr:OsmC family protein [Acidimicrobiales bacterium]
MATGTTTAEDGPAPKTLSVDATWDGGYRCRVRARQFEILVDEPLDSGGDDTGPQPTEIFLASLASCFALAVGHVARKRGIELPDLSVRAVGEYDGPRFVNLRVEVTSSHPRAELERLSERAASVCYVSNTLRAVDSVDVVVRQHGAD